MEELTIEQKAQRYDEALKKARGWYVDSQVDFKKSLENLFPVLKESGGEEIRKAIIECVKSYGPSSANPKLFKNMLAWLEKQGEQKSKFRVGDTIKCKYDDRQFTIKSVDLDKGIYTYTQEGCGNDIDYADEEFELVEQKPSNKVEPKFKVGDWVVWDNKISCRVDNIYQGKESLMYTIIDTNNMTRGYSVKGFDNNAYLWTTKDANDGDVLVDDKGRPFIFKGFLDVKHLNCPVAYCGISINYYGTTEFCISERDHWWCNQIGVKPATKEQYDLLFKKMKEAGYEWDIDKKELNKTEPEEEFKDEFWRQKTIILIKHPDLIKSTPNVAKIAVDWLESIKGKI